MMPRTLRLPVSERFTSIQGEGKLTGTPSAFIRLSGCNLRCAWCDTPYASWTPDGESINLDVLMESATNTGVRHVVITGGEPMLFKHLPVLCEALRSRGLHVTIETAGTIYRRVVCDLLSISPKLANSTPRNDPRDPTGVWAARHEQRRLNPRVLQSLTHLVRQQGSDLQLKFVVSAPADLTEIETLLKMLRHWNPEDILLMPEGVTVPAPETKAWIERECASRGWRYCPRLHIELFGNVRGT